MARAVRDSRLENRSVRGRLAVKHRPHYRLIEQGLHLGYRKRSSGGPGTWIARRYLGDGKYHVENLRTPDGQIIFADDYDDADGKSILSFAQAQRAAKGPRIASGALTVADVVADYLLHLRRRGKSERSLYEVECRINAHVLPALGSVKVAALSADRLRQWLDQLATGAARVRTRAGNEQGFKDAPKDEDGKRARRASANRVFTVLRAALNHAYNEGKVDQRTWRRVKPFENVEKARARYLEIAQAQRLVNASSADFRPLAQAALYTGCRYGELTRLTVADYNADAGTLAIQRSKSGKPRHVVLNDEGMAFFERLCAGRDGGELMLRKANGAAWEASQQAHAIHEACRRARITPEINFHGLRHTWASHAVMNGTPLMVVARNLGHKDISMVQKHYGHLARDYLSDQIKKGAPKFGFAVDTKVTALKRR